MNKVSARDVASEAGVSAPVVSWVANGTATQHRITEATQCRVRAVIERMGYGSSPGAGAVVGCQVAELLGENPKVSQFSILNNQQLNNVTTALSALGCELVSVASMEDLTSLPGGRLVGVVYQVAGVGVQGSVEKELKPVVVPVPVVSVPLPVVPIKAPIEDAAGTAATTEEVPGAVESPVESSVVTAVPGGTVTSENPPGTDGDGTSPSTLAAEPVTVDPVAESVVPASVVPPVDADVPAAPLPITQEPVTVPAPVVVLAPAPVDIEVADPLPETPHLDPLPQGERKENEPTPEPPPQPPPVAVVVSEQPTPEPPVVEPIPPVAEEAAVPVVVSEPIPEPVTVDPPPEPIQAPVEDAAETVRPCSPQAAATTEEVPVAVESPVESSVVTAIPGGTVTEETTSEPSPEEVGAADQLPLEPAEIAEKVTA